MRVAPEPRYDAVRGREGGADDLIHVVIAILGEPTHESHVWARVRSRLVALEQQLVLSSRNRIEGLPVRLRVFAHDRRALVRLAGEVLEFRDSRVGVIVRIVDRRHFLKSAHAGKMLVLEFHRAIRKSAIAEVEVRVDRPRVHEMAIAQRVAHRGEVDSGLVRDKRVLEHASKHGRIALASTRCAYGRHLVKRDRKSTIRRLLVWKMCGPYGWTTTP